MGGSHYTSRTMMALTQVSLLLCVTYVAAFSSSFSPVTHRAPVVTRSTGAFRHSPINMGAVAADEKVVVIGVAADSGCGKSTFMRRLTKMFGGDAELLDIGRETNTLVSEAATVICLDDYHKYDRTGRSENGITALHKDCQKWDLMYEQVKALKEGKKVYKPIYNHITGELDEPEEVNPTDIMIFEGLHPMLDERVRELLDFTVYLDITDDVKFAWKIQRDMAERGHSLESIKEAIEGRKPDFDAFVAPQRADADIVIQVLPTDLVDDDTGKLLKVKFIMKNGLEGFTYPYLFDEDSTVSWTPCGSKLSCAYPGVKFAYYQDNFLGSDVTVLEMDGKLDNLEELVYVESHLSNCGTKFYGELTESMVKNQDSPGSHNGSGLFQALCAFKIREVYEAMNQE